ncbi:hypothetical protein Y1Q_0019065 [Alligator mississippiensis]|uniref:Uncharacterized protein n=1 Tax=Alligator mississippiensis TaxID=8496 RepID=A0A151N1A5_ALLMI|nr:hypothetical protein Y1Q_0019065 [Alligator mississippiensis]
MWLLGCTSMGKVRGMFDGARRCIMKKLLRSDDANACVMNTKSPYQREQETSYTSWTSQPGETTKKNPEELVQPSNSQFCPLAHSFLNELENEQDKNKNKEDDDNSDEEEPDSMGTAL